MRIRLQPYRATSRSARDVAQASDVLRVNLVRTRFRPREGDVVVNWGSGVRLFDDSFYLNQPYHVAVATDKLAATRVLSDAGVHVPPWTTSQAMARQYLERGWVIVCRTMLRASAGRGIVVCEQGDDVPVAPLYTKYVPKFDEYRVHVWKGEVLDIQQKRRRNGEQDTDTRIRNTSNGWVFCREGVNCPEVATEQAIAAVAALGLDFGAADVGYTQRNSRATVYEVNTAPGVEGTTLRKYADAINACNG